MEASHKTHRPHIKVGKDEEEEDDSNSVDSYPREIILFQGTVLLIYIIMSKDNYRPNAPASVVSKVAESIIFNRISCYLDTCPNQFGYKRNHGTDQCICVLKEIIDAYRVMNGSVFTCLFRCQQGL